MKLFKPITDMWNQVQSLTENAGLLLEAASGGGIDGLMRQFMGMTPDGLINKVNADMGSGVMRLVSEGEQDSLKTAIEWRDYVVSRLEELRDAAIILNKFNSEDIDKAKEAVGEMSEYLKDRGPEIARRRKERAMETELRRLQKMVKEMSEFLETDTSTDGLKEGKRPQSSSGSRSNSERRASDTVVEETKHND